MHAVPDRATDGESGNHPYQRNHGFASSGKGLSLITFFGPAKKVIRQGGSFALALLRHYRADAVAQDQKHFALMREFISFAGTKETEPKKSAFPDEANLLFDYYG